MLTPRMPFFFNGTAFDFNGYRLADLADPTSPQDASTKNYVDLAVATIAAKDDAQAATTGILPGTYTYSNGSAGIGATLTAPSAAVLTIDGYVVALNDRLLIKNEANASHNGIYSVTTLGTISVPTVLTRTTDFDRPSVGINGALVYVLNGTTNGNTLWSCTTGATITFGTTNINWSTFAGSTYSADETTLHLAGTTFSIISTYVGQTSITTLGTIGTGTWQGTKVGLAYGGTNADLSATGGPSQVLKQETVGAAITVGQPSVCNTPTDDISLVSTEQAQIDGAFTLTSGRKVTLASGAKFILDAPFQMPVGSLMAFAGTAIPGGWLMCDGSAVSRTTYATLFSVIGVIWGVGDGSTTFNLPDLRGSAPIGAGKSGSLTNRVLGTVGGEENHVLLTAEMPSHTHKPQQAIGASASGGNALLSTAGAQGANTTSAGSDGAHNNMQPWAAVNFIIKA